MVWYTDVSVSTRVETAGRIFSRKPELGSSVLITAERIVWSTGEGRSVGEELAIAVTMWIAAVERAPSVERVVAAREAVGVEVGVWWFMLFARLEARRRLFLEAIEMKHRCRFVRRAGVVVVVDMRIRLCRAE